MTRHHFSLPFGTNIHGPISLFKGSYGADPDQVSVSGLSSGAYMTVQMQVAHSKTFMGAGVVAGGKLFFIISLLIQQYCCVIWTTIDDILKSYFYAVYAYSGQHVLWALLAHQMHFTGVFKFYF